MIDSLPDKAQEVYDEGFEAGKDEGYREGHSDGNAEGYDVGYDAGHAQGYEDGRDDNDWVGHVASLIQDRIYRMRTLDLDRDLTPLDVLDILLDEVNRLA